MSDDDDRSFEDLRRHAINDKKRCLTDFSVTLKLVSLRSFSLAKEKKKKKFSQMCFSLVLILIDEETFFVHLPSVDVAVVDASDLYSKLNGGIRTSIDFPSSFSILNVPHM